MREELAAGLMAAQAGGAGHRATARPPSGARERLKKNRTVWQLVYDYALKSELARETTFDGLVSLAQFVSARFSIYLSYRSLSTVEK